MTDFLSASCVAIAETCIGHPLDTMKILIQNNISYKKLPLKHYYKGWRFPFANSLLFNCTVFPMYERTLPYTNSHVFSGFLSGVAVTPFVFCSEVGKIMQQTQQNLNVNTFLTRKGRYSTLGRETIAMSCYFSIYQYANKELGFHPLVAGALSGLVNWTTTYPFDIIKSRQIAQNITFKQAFKQGYLWKGYPICAIRAIIVNGVNFYTYDTVKNLLENVK